jgi:hypothetical protein
LASNATSPPSAGSPSTSFTSASANNATIAKTRTDLDLPSPPHPNNLLARGSGIRSGPGDSLDYATRFTPQNFQHDLQKAAEDAKYEVQ